MAKVDKKQLGTAERLARLQLIFARLERDFRGSPRRHNPVIAKCIRACSARLDAASVQFFSGETDKAQKVLDLASIYIVFARQVLDSDEIEAAMGESDYLELSQLKPEDDLAQLFECLKAEIEHVRSTLGSQ
jgi:hypothetical protein